MTMYFLHTRQEQVAGSAAQRAPSPRVKGPASNSSGADSNNSRGTLQSMRTNNNSIIQNNANNKGSPTSPEEAPASTSSEGLQMKSHRTEDQAPGTSVAVL
eukprot:GDKJ01013243.1.p1 GENE.GDKJ01013243.1~~GDKJ01013243.1.p1  ORF type:complete len:101 (+),score=2.25 GDKJ01013243.1:1-303(+)